MPPLLFVATGLRGLQATPAAFANAVRSAAPASFELPPPSSPQVLALVLAAAVLTSPQAPDLETLASVLKEAVAGLATPTEAPSISFAVSAPVPKSPRAGAPPRVPEAPPQTRSPTPSPTDAALASLLEWIPTIPRGCEDKVAHAFHLQLFRHYRADANSLPQSPIREQWTWVRSRAPSLPGIAEVLRAFLASPPPVQEIRHNPAASPADVEAANQAAGAARKKGYTPQKVDSQVFSKALWVGQHPPRQVRGGALVHLGRAA